MRADADLAAVADLMSANRAALLLALIGGRPLRASELASRCAISRSLASAHLSRLLSAGLVAVEQHGRERRYSLAGPHVAHVLEAMLTIAPAKSAENLGETARGAAISRARTCYDHLAGAVGVALTESMVRQGLIAASSDSFELRPAGEARLADLGLNIGVLRDGRRALTRPCLDWSERRPHLAGALGAALYRRLSELRWVEPLPNSRAIRVTRAGRRGMLEAFGLNLTGMSGG